MKKFVLFTILTLFLNINVANARDILPISHNEFGETTTAIDLDSIKPYLNDTYSVEILNLADENWSSKDQIPIFKYDIDIENKQFRIIEYFSRYRRNWKIAQVILSNSQILEDNKVNWEKIEEDTPIEHIYSITYIVGKNGKKYYIVHRLGK